MRPFKSWYDWLGVFAAGLSLFHFFVHVQHLHVTVMIKEILHYYRMLFYPFASFVDGLIGQIFIRIFGWSVSIPRDFLILYALGGLSRWLRFVYMW